MKYHEHANLFPMMPKEDIIKLSEDIAREGLLQPITVHQGKILDGRNRWEACHMVGVKPDIANFKGKDALAFVVSCNLQRRHLSQSQKAALAVDLLPILKAEAKKRQVRKPTDYVREQIPEQTTGRARDKAAEMVGVNPHYVTDAEKIKTTSPKLFQDIVSGNTTVTRAKRDIKEAKRDTKRQENTQKVAKAKSVEKLHGVFSAILIDPPWDWSDEGDINQMGRAKPDYATMTQDQLSRFPVFKWADTDCHLYCWVTNRSMPKVFGLLHDWGFRYVTLLTWPKQSFGLGNYYRGQTEHIAFGIKGSQGLKRKDASTLLPSWARGKEHSSKPHEIYEFIESCSPGPYLEIFGRNVTRQGWAVVGEGSK